MDTLSLNQNLTNALEKKGFETFTEVQEKTIPLILDNKSLIIESKTGSGKTLAFLMPIFNKINLSEKTIQALVIAPTQELASQIYSEATLLKEQSELNVSSTLIIGGANINNQIKKIKEKPQIIIGTPKRILELIKLKKLPCHNIKTLVFDEADHVLDKNNFKTTGAIRKATLRDTQIIAFSATIDEGTTSRALSLMNKGEIVKLSKDKMSENVAHIIVECERRDKYEITNKILNIIKDEKCIIFTNSANDINLLEETLEFHKKKAIVLSGSKDKHSRKDAMEKFKSGSINILISSDLGARGLHIENINYIINLDYPLESNEYVHRAGRSGRNEIEGTSICIATKRDLSFINKYSKDLNVSFTKKRISNESLI
ncbi:DEAD/DEAH box helicase [uncultured Clostridium sp.]|uniref:DEAD/DEAH box helicase n=1 Tax=uncultured Clostridium sp. TaxID=59620 RepID=UPI00260F9F21|nr:DEAD/DEAH box helicase [uncultured Clostridium sp.]